MLNFGVDLDELIDVDALEEAPEALDAPVELTPDPEPVTPPEPRRFGRRRKVADSPVVKVTAAVRKDVQAKVALFLSIGASAWAGRDPLCGQVALEVVPDTSKALTDILCESPDVVAFLTKGSAFVKWIALAQALQPLGAVVYAHHVARTVALPEEMDAEAERLSYVV
jgi:hypothetical protein